MKRLPEDGRMSGLEEKTKSTERAARLPNLNSPQFSHLFSGGAVERGQGRGRGGAGASPAGRERGGPAETPGWLLVPAAGAGAARTHPVLGVGLTRGQALDTGLGLRMGRVPS